MPGETIQYDIEALFREGQDLRGALLAHDLTQARLRARQLAGVAALLRFPGVESAAISLVEALGPEGNMPDPSYGPAVFALSDALDEATRVVGHG